MRNGPDKMGWRAVIVLSVIAIEIVRSECCAQSPEPITLIQGVEMARSQIPPSRLHFHIVFRDPLRKSEKDYVMEFDGDRRRSAALTPPDVRLFYDSSQACRYVASLNQAAFSGIDDSTADALFDPRTLGLNSGLTWAGGVSGELPYKQGRVQMIGREQVRGINTWHVQIKMEHSTKYQIDLWIGDTERFPVYRYDMTFDTERRSIMSFYENQAYPWLPSKVDTSSFNTDGTVRYGLVATLTKAEANVAFTEANWTLAGLNLPIGTQVMDRRTKLTIGYWNGTNVTPFEVWVASQLAKPDVATRPRHSQGIVFIILFATVAVFPVLLWKGLRAKKQL